MLCRVIGIIATEAGAYDNSSPATQKACRTDHGTALSHSPWIRCAHPLRMLAESTTIHAASVSCALHWPAMAARPPAVHISHPEGLLHGPRHCALPLPLDQVQ